MKLALEFTDEEHLEDVMSIPSIPLNTNQTDTRGC